MTLRQRIDRWRASKGYGVHAPLAFRLATTVVRAPKDAVYYGEERLQAFPGLGGRLLERATLLLRLTAFLQPSYVWLAPGVPDALKEAISLSGCVVRVYDGTLYPSDMPKSDFVVGYGSKINKGLIKTLMDSAKTFVWFDAPPFALAEASRVLKGGVMLEGIESMIVVQENESAPHIYGLRRF